MNHILQRTKPWHMAVVMVWLTITVGCMAIEEQSSPAVPPEAPSAALAGFLPARALPDSLTLLPPPPADGSPALALDEAVSQECLKLQGTPRWQLAAQDADLKFPAAAGTFSCALGAPITEQETPHLYRLLRRAMMDAGLVTRAAKNNYRRQRPFALNHQPTCTPKLESLLLRDGSYPSGHTSTGWAWALILTEIAPDRADAILARGLAFGDSRLVCNVHWQSDVTAGRTLGAAVVARLHADPQFLSEIATAKRELAAVRSKGLAPTRDCSAEAEALGSAK